MSGVIVARSLSTLDTPHPISVEDFYLRDFDLDPAEAQRLTVLRFYSQYDDMVIGPSMLDAFVQDLEIASDALVVLNQTGTVADPTSAMNTVVETARANHAHIVLLGD